MAVFTGLTKSSVKTKELVNPLYLVNQAFCKGWLTASAGLTKSCGNVFLLVNPVVCDEEFLALLCGHSVLKFPRVGVCKAKKLSHLLAVVVGYKPKMFAFLHVLCKSLVVKACMKVPPFAVKEMVQR